MGQLGATLRCALVQFRSLTGLPCCFTGIGTTDTLPHPRVQWLTLPAVLDRTADAAWLPWDGSTGPNPTTPYTITLGAQVKERLVKLSCGIAHCMALSNLGRVRSRCLRSTTAHVPRCPRLCCPRAHPRA